MLIFQSELRYFILGLNFSLGHFFSHLRDHVLTFYTILHKFIQLLLEQRLVSLLVQKHATLVLAAPLRYFIRELIRSLTLYIFLLDLLKLREPFLLYLEALPERLKVRGYVSHHLHLAVLCRQISGREPRKFGHFLPEHE